MVNDLSVPDSKAEGITRPQTDYHYLPGDWTAEFVNQCYKNPALAAAETAAGAITVGSLIKYAPQISEASFAGCRLFKGLPGLTSFGVATVGASKLWLTDWSDLRDSLSKDGLFSTSALHNLASVGSDLAMIGGGVMRWIPQLKPNSWLASTAGALGRSASGIAWDASNSEALNGGTFPDATERRATTHSISVRNNIGGLESREYDLYLPKNYDGKDPLPVMFVLHGCYDKSPRGLMEADTGMDRIADERTANAPQGFAVVYPVSKVKDGTADWNSPGAGLTPTDSRYDDVEYFKSIVNDLSLNRELKIDLKSMHLSGFSSGGEFVEHLRGRMPHVFASVFSDHGTLRHTEAPALPGGRAAFTAVVSDNDQMLPPHGGFGAASWLYHNVLGKDVGGIAQSEPLAQFKVAAQDNCATGKPTVTQFDHVTLSEYPAAQTSGYPVKEYFIHSNHDGRSGGVLGSVFGRGPRGIATQHAWDGAGAGGLNLVGEKSNCLDTSRLAAELIKYRLPD